MTDILKLPQQPERVETGIIQFGDDWPGHFMRGKHALYFGFLLGALLDGQKLDMFSERALRGYANSLSLVRPKPPETA